jgi:hypothetical protein
VLPEKTEKIRKAVIKDWFRFALWFVRIRKAARASMSSCQNKEKSKEDSAYFPHSLLEL